MSGKRSGGGGGAVVFACIVVVASTCFLAADAGAEHRPPPSAAWRWNSGAQPSPAAAGNNKNGQADDGDPWYPAGQRRNLPQPDQWTAPEHPADDRQYPYGDDTTGYPLAPPIPEQWGEQWDDDQGDNGFESPDARGKSRRRGKKRTRTRGEGDGGGGDGDIDGVEFDENGVPVSSDLVKEYMRSFKGRMLLSGSASVVGAALGAVISKSTIQRTPLMSLVGLFLGLVLSVARGAFGDLFRALGLALTLALRRSRYLSAEYPLLPYARRALVMAPRRPFPPAENPWKYRREEALRDARKLGMEDGMWPAEFSMSKALLAVTFLGGFAGYLVAQFLFVPTFVLALGGAGFLAYMTTTRNARGDLARIVGMRTVAFLGLLSEINSDVGLSRKAKVVGGICFSKAMFWDRKYKIKDRILVILSNLYVALAKTVGRVQRDAVGVGDEDDELDVDDDINDDLNARFSSLNEAFTEGGGGARTGQSRSKRRRRQPDAADAPPPPPPPSGPPPGLAREGGGAFQGGGARDYF